MRPTNTYTYKRFIGQRVHTFNHIHDHKPLWNFFLDEKLILTKHTKAVTWLGSVCKNYEFPSLRTNVFRIFWATMNHETCKCFGCRCLQMYPVCIMLSMQPTEIHNHRWYIIIHPYSQSKQESLWKLAVRFAYLSLFMYLSKIISGLYQNKTVENMPLFYLHVHNMDMI